MGKALDVFCTYSTSDWAISERHKGKHGFNTVEDLKAKIDQDISLQNEDSAHIILVHDQFEIFKATTDLISYFQSKGFVFQ